MAGGKASRKRETGLSCDWLAPEDYHANFSDLHPPLSGHEASVAADRCYFCYDAPCTTACPTEIDIPQFIRQIATHNPLGSAKTIFEQNILGGMCARVCPTEELCEQACVREAAEGKPVEIGRLQRYATDIAMAADHQFFHRAASTGKSIAIVGAGPAGLACAHRLASLGHEVIVFDQRPKAGGLNEYGIAAYKTVDDFAQREVKYLTGIGGIDIQHEQRLGQDFTLADLSDRYDAIFLGLGLGGTKALDLHGQAGEGYEDAVTFIEQLRQSDDLSKIPVARNVIVIGGGMTAIDAAVQAKLLGAENVTLCYRRGKAAMNASSYEQDLAATKGVTLRHFLQPKGLIRQDGRLVGLELEYTRMEQGQLVGTGESLTLAAEQVLTAIGQTLDEDFELTKESGKIKVDPLGRMSAPKVWAGGDCASGGDDLTVSAVAMGRDAAMDIHQSLQA